MIARTLFLVGLLACRLNVAPVFLVGDATYAVVARGSDTVFFKHDGDHDGAVAPGDSVCATYHASGQIEDFTVWSATVPAYQLSYVPADRYPSVTFVVGDGVRVISITPRRCR